jgi:hypothetical protein
MMSTNDWSITAEEIRNMLATVAIEFFSDDDTLPSFDPYADTQPGTALCG